MKSSKEERVLSSKGLVTDCRNNRLAGLAKEGANEVKVKDAQVISDDENRQVYLGRVPYQLQELTSSA